ncbi:hypothetical protein J6590_088552 [Homalodisca vitripennis]|nr:hypothetical protein J6590_080693 [Homalodisca vitripennis]KAG8299957.1 hypothetical protein J6590_088552 [Homalodisca vitripennis]
MFYIFQKLFTTFYFNLESKALGFQLDDSYYALSSRNSSDCVVRFPGERWSVQSLAFRLFDPILSGFHEWMTGLRYRLRQTQEYPDIIQHPVAAAKARCHPRLASQRVELRPRQPLLDPSTSITSRTPRRVADQFLLWNRTSADDSCCISYIPLPSCSTNDRFEHYTV